MDWKAFYRDELTSPAGRAAADAGLGRHAGGDAAVTGVFRERGILCFPHVTLRDSADPIARVVQSILALGARRVVALGVLHGGTLPEPRRAELAELHHGSPRAGEIFGRLGGAFVARGTARTPWGDVPDGPAPRRSDLVREDAALLANEFSLDLFLALLASAANRRGVATPEVTRVFVSVTRDPGGGFVPATAVADAVRPLITGDAVCVATGDLVHFGNSYTPPGEMAGMPDDAAGLVAHFRPRIDEMHDAALVRRDFATASEIASQIRSDQRNVLSVIAELAGPGAQAEVFSFALSDYAVINRVAPPCFVASALVGFRPAR